MGPDSLLAGADDAPALIEAASHTTVSHSELRRLVAERRNWSDHYKSKLVFIGVEPTIGCIVDLLALFASGATTAFLNPSTPAEVVNHWIQNYRPQLIAGLGEGLLDSDPTLELQQKVAPIDAVLLPTSGSTGNPKFVRLSSTNVIANATQIASALSLSPSHRALGHLPLFYSYGLSVLTSHLIAGASVVLTKASAVQPEFWHAMEHYEVSSLPGVPYHYEMYKRMKLAERDLPALKDVTQAGGRLNDARIAEFHTSLAAKGIRMWVMYGQTEATARIAVMPHDELGGRIGSVGYSVPGGEIKILDADAEGVGEVQYSGPNVMLGYSESRDDLNRGDSTDQVLLTGDLGRLDSDGRLWIVGRTKRIAKVFGTRVNLDDVEQKLDALGVPLAATSGDDIVKVFVESREVIDGFARQCERALGFSPGSIKVEYVDRLPLTAAGKVAYQELPS